MSPPSRAYPFGVCIRRLFLARFPAKWNNFAEKEPRDKNVEQTPIAKVFNFGGICSIYLRLLPTLSAVPRQLATWSKE
jgi:hypothetical protein